MPAFDFTDFDFAVFVFADLEEIESDNESYDMEYDMETVGDGVGFTVGVLVGFAVGFGVGFAVGNGVGFAVGLKEGEREGFSVGAIEGDLLPFECGKKSVSCAWAAPRNSSARRDPRMMELMVDVVMMELDVIICVSLC